MLRQRVVTALVLAPLFVAAVFNLPPPALMVLFALVTLLAANEWADLSQLETLGKSGFILAIVATSALCWFGLNDPMVVIHLANVWWLVAIAYLLWRNRNHQSMSPIVLRILCGLVALVSCWIALGVIVNQEGYSWLLLSLFLIIWSADIGAYFIGKGFGKRKLARQISPGKSVEGALGGLLSVVLVSVILGAAVFKLERSQLVLWILAAIAVAIVSIAGDLIESVLKRDAGVKDSGKLLPGHGGVLDRCDSVIAAAPVFIFCWMNVL